MAKKDPDFVSPDKIQVIIPYKDFEKLVKMAENVEAMEAKYKRMEEMYNAMYGMFSECIQKIADVWDYVSD